MLRVLVFIVSSWLVLVAVNKLNPYSKLNYYVNDDEAFMRPFDVYLNSSLVARRELQRWLQSNYKRAGLSSANERLFNRDITPTNNNNNNNNNNNEHIHSRDGEHRLCVAVVSKERAGKRACLIQTVMSLLTRIPLRYQDRVWLSVFDVSTHPSLHPELRTLAPLVNIVRLEDAYVDDDYVDADGEENEDGSLRDLLSSDASLLAVPKVKEAYDYSRSMAYILRHKPQCTHALLVEDDAVAAPDWYTTLVAHLDTLSGTSADGRSSLSSSSSSARARTERWQCLKLFTSFRGHDWLTHPATVLKALVYAALLSFVSIVAFQRYCVNFSPQGATMRSFASSAALCINATLLVAWLKSTSISPLGYGLVRFAQGFNTVANVYAAPLMLNMTARHIDRNLRQFAQHVASARFHHHQRAEFEPKDLTQNRLRAEHGLDEYIVEPALFQHVGLHSSMSSGELNLHDIHLMQYRPFRSYSFFKEHFRPIRFDPGFSLRSS